MYRPLRLLAVSVTAALALSLDAPAHAAASACTHHLSGPQICISTTGPSGSANPGTVHTAWTNPPANRSSATVYITEPGGQTYTLTARRRGDRLVASFIPRIQADGKLCARYQDPAAQHACRSSTAADEPQGRPAASSARTGDHSRPARQPGQDAEPMTENPLPRIYGTDHDDPAARTTRPGHDYVELLGGPLDGQLLDVTGISPDERTAGAYLITPQSAYGPGRASYGPTFSRPTGPWVWEGDTP